MFSVLKKHFDLGNLTSTKLLVSKENYDLKVNVSFDSNGGSTVSDQKFIVEDTYSDLLTSTKSGYVLDGWYYGSRQITDSDSVDFRIKSLTAQWKEMSWYIEDGLVGCWDGEFNNGMNSHSNTITTWKNLGSTGSTYNASRSAVNWGSNYAYFNGTSIPRFVLNSTGFLSNVLKGEWTVEVVFQPNSGWFSNFSSLFGVHGSDLGLVFGQYVDGTIAFSVYAPDNIFVQYSSSAFDTSKIYTMVMTASSTNLIQKSYKNGIQASSASTSASSITFTNSEDVQIGAAYKYSNRNFYGKIFCVRCYNKMLSDSEIISNFNVDKERFGIV